jgi:uncharacterized protein
MDYRKLETLVNLKNAGEISMEEFQVEKEKLRTDIQSPLKSGSGLGVEDNSYYILMHLSQFCGLLMPLLGSIIPLILWIQNKENDEKIDLHGRIVFNWVFSVFIYTIGSIILIPMLGRITFVILLLLNIIFPLIGTFKAKKGKFWRYPLSINFFDVTEN